MALVRSGMASKDVAEMLGGVERRGGLQLGQSRRIPEPRGGGQEPHRLWVDRRLKSMNATRVLLGRLFF